MPPKKSPSYALPQDVQETDRVGTYLAEISEFELLTPELEKDYSRRIEKADIAAWTRLLSCAEHVASIVEVLAVLEAPPDTAKLVRAARALERPGSAATQKRRQHALIAIAAELAPIIRTQDLDQVHMIAALRVTNNTPREAVAAHREGKHLRDEFVRANLRLVITMARRYDRGAMPLADLIQEGNLGLMHAVSRFDYRRDLRFSTYACWRIRHAIGRALADKARTVRVSVHMLEAQQLLERTRTRLTDELRRSPTDEELSAASKVPVRKIVEMRKLIMGEQLPLEPRVDPRAARNHTYCRDHGTWDEESPYLVDPSTEEHQTDDEVEQRALYELLHAQLERMGRVEQTIVRLRYGMDGEPPMTLRQISDRLGLTREEVRKIQVEVVDRLRVGMGGDE